MLGVSIQTRNAHSGPGPPIKGKQEKIEQHAGMPYLRIPKHT
jgi:hypothetical protein